MSVLFGFREEPPPVMGASDGQTAVLQLRSERGLLDTINAMWGLGGEWGHLPVPIPEIKTMQGCCLVLRSCAPPQLQSRQFDRKVSRR